MLRALTPIQKGIFLALGGYSVFSLSDTCAKWLSLYYPVELIVGYSHFFAFVFCLLLSPLLGGLKNTIRTQKLFVHLGRGFCNLTIAILAVLCYAHMPLAEAYTIFFLTPFIITILAIPFYHEKVPFHGWAVIAFGFSGVLVAFQPWLHPVDIWVGFALLTALLVAILGLLARALNKNETLLSLSFYPVLIPFLFVFPYSFFVHEIPSLIHLPIFALSGCFTFLGLMLVASAYRCARYAVVAPFHYVQMLWAIALGYGVFGDIPAVATIVGALMITASGIALIYLEKKSNKNSCIPISSPY